MDQFKRETQEKEESTNQKHYAELQEKVRQIELLTTNNHNLHQQKDLIYHSKLERLNSDHTTEIRDLQTEFN